MSAAYSLVAPTLFFWNEEYAYDTRIKSHESTEPKAVQIFISSVVSSHIIIAPKNAIDAYVRIPPNPVAHQGFVP